MLPQYQEISMIYTKLYQDCGRALSAFQGPRLVQLSSMPSASKFTPPWSSSNPGRNFRCQRLLYRRGLDWIHVGNGWKQGFHRIQWDLMVYIYIYISNQQHNVWIHRTVHASNVIREYWIYACWKYTLPLQTYTAYFPIKGDGHQSNNTDVQPCLD